MSCPILRFNPALSLPLDAAPAPLPPVAWEDEEEAFGRRYDEVGEDEVFFLLSDGPFGPGGLLVILA